MEWIIGCWVLIGLVIGWYWLKEKKKLEKSGVPKGSLGWPFIGETLDFIACGYSSKPVRFMDKRKSLYGKVFKTNILGTPIIVSTDTEVNKAVLLNQGNNFIPAYPKSVRELFGKNSILHTNGSPHKRMHALILGFLRSPPLKARVTKVFEDSVKHSLATWKDNNPIYIQNESKKLTFDVLVNTLTSVGPGENLNFLKSDFQEFIKGLICLPINLPGTRFYKSLKAKERLIKRVKTILEERKESMNFTDEKAPINDAVDLLLRDSSESSEKQSLPLDSISGNIIEMMIPGDETMVTAMTLAVKFLSDSPVALQKLVEENMELKKRKTDSGEDYAWSEYMSLQFTQNVISETLRMANIINGVWRKALKDVGIKGYSIPQGWCVLASFISVHMNEDNYENPYQFNPWRWEKMEATVNNNFFTPFGGGQRLCPGLEYSRLQLSIFLHHLVTTYRWVARQDEIVYFPTVKMKRKLPITVTSINTTP